MKNCNQKFLAQVPGAAMQVMLTLFIVIFAASMALAQGKAYVTIGAENRVAVLDTTTNTVVASIPVGSVPFGLAISPDAAFVYVSESG